MHQASSAPSRSSRSIARQLMCLLPLAAPVLIFGVAAADAASVGLAARPHLLLLSALLAAALPLCPLAAGAALRSAAE